MPAEYSNVWSRTVALLDEARARQILSEAIGIANEHQAQTDWDRHETLMVSVIDRASPRTVTVSWRDALSGSYGHQVWRTSLAKRPGRCVLSGQTIKRGDPVYRPGSAQPRPGNAGAMILASCIGAIPDDCPSGQSTTAGP